MRNGRMALPFVAARFGGALRTARVLAFVTFLLRLSVATCKLPMPTLSHYWTMMPSTLTNRLGLGTPSGLPADAVEALATHGFVVIPGPFSPEALTRLQAAYDDACAHASPDEVHIGRSSTRVTNFVNRGAEFEPIYTWAPALD